MLNWMVKKKVKNDKKKFILMIQPVLLLIVSEEHFPQRTEFPTFIVLNLPLLCGYLINN